MDDVFSVFKYLSSFQFPKFIIFNFAINLWVKKLTMLLFVLTAEEIKVKCKEMLENEYIFILLLAVMRGYGSYLDEMQIYSIYTVSFQKKK